LKYCGEGGVKRRGGKSTGKGVVTDWRGRLEGDLAEKTTSEVRREFEKLVGAAPPYKVWEAGPGSAARRQNHTACTCDDGARGYRGGQSTGVRGLCGRAELT